MILANLFKINKIAHVLHGWRYSESLSPLTGATTLSIKTHHSVICSTMLNVNLLCYVFTVTLSVVNISSLMFSVLILNVDMLSSLALFNLKAWLTKHHLMKWYLIKWQVAKITNHSKTFEIKTSFPDAEGKTGEGDPDRHGGRVVAALPVSEHDLRLPRLRSRNPDLPHRPWVRVPHERTRRKKAVQGELFTVTVKSFREISFKSVN